MFSPGPPYDPGPPTGSLRPLISWLFKWKLDELRHYIRTVQGALTDKFDALGAEFEERAKGMTEAERNWYGEQEAGDAFQLTEDFPELMWQTAFIHMYFHLEHGLIELCENVRTAGKFTKPVTDRNNKGITAAKNFLIKVAGVKFPFEGRIHGRVWRDVLCMGELRNIFAHAMGHVKDKPSPQLRQYIKRTKNLIEIDVSGRITFKDGYCLEAIDVVEKFFQSVLDAVPDNKLL